MKLQRFQTIALPLTAAEIKKITELTTYSWAQCLGSTLRAGKPCEKLFTIGRPRRKQMSQNREIAIQLFAFHA